MNLVMMKRLALVAWIFFVATPAAADQASEKLNDNPAFCFGFLSAQSQEQATSSNRDALSQREAQIHALFAKQGPKDSTDERGFDDWEKIGRDAATQQNDKQHNRLLKKCRRLLTNIKK